MVGRKFSTTHPLGISVAALVIAVLVLIGCAPITPVAPTGSATPETEAEEVATPAQAEEAEAEETPTAAPEEEATAEAEEEATATPEAEEEVTPTPEAEEEATPEAEEEATPEAEEEATPEAEEEPADEGASGSQSSGGGGVMDIFPAGYEAETDLLLFSCGSCHSWVCAVIDQRPESHWNTVQATHRDRVSNLSDSEFEQLFAFLKGTFNDQNPEPDLPAELRSLGCTTQ